MANPSIAETVVIKPTNDVVNFKKNVRKTYTGHDMNVKIADDIIEIVENLEKGSFTVNERRGEPVLNQLFPINRCEEYESIQEGDPYTELPPNFYISLEAYETHCTEYRDSAYVPVIVFHVCSINNELMTVLNREMYPEAFRAAPDTILPSKAFKGRIAVAFSVGGY